MALHPIYAITSIGRPLDPAWPTNRALLFVLPAIALAWAGVTFARGAAPAAAGGAGLEAALIAFGAWALARELAPDDDLAAFLAIAGALAAVAWLPGASVLLLFLALLLARVVNRSTGLAARWYDSAMVAGLAAWAVVDLDAPWLGLAAALAFALDASLRQPLRRQWIFAALCVGAAAVGARVGGVASLAPSWSPAPAAWAALAVLTAFAVAIAATRRVTAPGDVGGAPLLAARVRGGMGVAWLAALAACLRGEEGIASAGAVLGTMAAVATWRVLPGRLRRARW